MRHILHSVIDENVRVLDDCKSYIEQIPITLLIHLNSEGMAISLEEQTDFG